MLIKLCILLTLRMIVLWHGSTVIGVARSSPGGNGAGDRNDQLNRPTDVFLDKENDSLIICERKNRAMASWK